jgi:hypothetical protein
LLDDDVAVHAGIGAATAGAEIFGRFPGRRSNGAARPPKFSTAAGSGSAAQGRRPSFRIENFMHHHAGSKRICRRNSPIGFFQEKSESENQ